MDGEDSLEMALKLRRKSNMRAPYENQNARAVLPEDHIFIISETGVKKTDTGLKKIASGKVQQIDY